jgi:hypothetical protein
MFSRYIIRGSLEGTNQGLWHFMFSYLWLVKTILYNYALHYAVVFLLIVIFIWLAISRKKLKIVFSENGYRFMWLSLTPVVLLHVFFLNYSVQDFSVLYASLFFSVLLGILYDKIKKSGQVSLMKMRIGLAVTVGLLIVQFQMIDGMSLFLDSPAYYKEAGRKIAAQTEKDEMIFTSQTEIEPQIIFYAQRNIRFAKDTVEAKEFLNATGNKKGVFVTWLNSFGNASVQTSEPVLTNALNH